MNDPAHSIAGIRDLTDAQQELENVAADEGLEYVGREHGTNRKARRDYVRALKAATRRPEGDKRWYQPILGTLTPYAAKERARRRAASKVARASRRVNLRRARGLRS